MYLGGDAISGEFVGDLQGINNIEAPSGWRLYESWVQMSFGETATSLRAGVLDLNAEFDTPVTQGLFIGSPFGIGTDLSQTGVRGPVVWPTTGLGLRVAGNAGEALQWRFGVYDGAPGTDDDDFTSMRVSSDEGALLIGELEYSSDRIHKLSVGSWAYTAEFERLDAALQPAAEPESGNYGLYATFDLALGSAGPVDFDAALRAGTAPAKFNAVDRYFGAAVTATHLWEGRPDDALGLGVAWAHVGEPYRDVSDFDGMPATRAETLIELAYRADLTDWVALVPNVQFIAAPGALRDLDDSWVVGLRFELARAHSWQLTASRDAPADGGYARRSK
jgi:porin